MKEEGREKRKKKGGEIEPSRHRVGYAFARYTEKTGFLLKSLSLPGQRWPVTAQKMLRV